MPSKKIASLVSLIYNFDRDVQAKVDKISEKIKQLNEATETAVNDLRKVAEEKKEELEKFFKEKIDELERERRQIPGKVHREVASLKEKANRKHEEAIKTVVDHLTSIEG